MKANSFYKPNQNLLNEVGFTIRILRKRKGLTLEALAKECGLHPKYIQGCETGNRNLSISVLNDIATKGLGMSIKTLINKMK